MTIRSKIDNLAKRRESLALIAKGIKGKQHQCLQIANKLVKRPKSHRKTPIQAQTLKVVIGLANKTAQIFIRIHAFHQPIESKQN